jgi:transposase-like protein
MKWFKQEVMSAVHKLINSIWNKEELPDQWKESIVVPIHKKGEKTYCNYCGISLLSTLYKMLSNILLSKLSRYMYLSEVHINVCICKHLSYNFPIQNGDTLSPLLSNLALECAIKKVQENQIRLKLTGTYISFWLMLMI